MADTKAVLATIGAEGCVVGGWSGGGPHALACAARLDEAAAVLLIASVAPYEADGLDWMAGMGEENVTEFGSAVQGEERLRPYLEQMREHLTEVTAADIVTSLGSVLPEVDRAVLALRIGVDGWLDDDLAFVKPWGFDLSEVSIPTMIWQGRADLMVPFAHGQWLCSQLPHASVNLERGEGHLSVGLGALDRMLDELVEALRSN